MEAAVAARGPKQCVSTSIERKQSHESRMPQSSASHSTPVSMLLFARRFIPTTERTSRVKITGGTLLSSRLSSENALFMREQLLVF